MRKLFYFVRHGESILNAEGIRQGRKGSLSEKGKEQASLTGKRLEHHPIETILASPYTRTKETAEIIQKYLKKPLEYSELLIERKNPSEIIGKSTEDPEVKKIVELMDKTYHDDNFRFSDEENFSDLKTRAKETLKFLASRKEKFILVVTHGIFLRMIVALIVEGDKLTASAYNKISYLNGSNNASITICEYKDGFFTPKKEKGWKLIAWDDYSIRKESDISKPI